MDFIDEKMKKIKEKRSFSLLELNLPQSWRSKNTKIKNNFLYFKLPFDENSIFTRSTTEFHSTFDRISTPDLYENSLIEQIIDQLLCTSFLDSPSHFFSLFCILFSFHIIY